MQNKIYDLLSPGICEVLSSIVGARAKAGEGTARRKDMAFFWGKLSKAQATCLTLTCVLLLIWQMY